MFYKEELISVLEEATEAAKFEARMGIALSMLSSGMSYEEIEKYTQVTKEEIVIEIERNMDWDTEWDNVRNVDRGRHWNHVQENGMKKQAEVSTEEVGEKLAVNFMLEMRLKEWRAEHYKALNIPAYMVIPNKTLLEIAARIPHSREELMAIKGFGETRWEKFGQEILAVTSEF